MFLPQFTQSKLMAFKNHIIYYINSFLCHLHDLLLLCLYSHLSLIAPLDSPVSEDGPTRIVLCWLYCLYSNRIQVGQGCVCMWWKGGGVQVEFM